MIATMEESCKFVTDGNVDRSAAVRFYPGSEHRPNDIVEITHGDALMGYDPISFRTVQDFKTFLKMLMRFDERL